MKRLRTIVTIGSGATCFLLLVLLPISYHLNPASSEASTGRLLPHDSIAITSGFHLGIFNGGVWFFSHEVPYMGSIMMVGDSDTREAFRGWQMGDYGFGQTTYIGKKGAFVERKRGCDLPGIYFRAFQAASMWTLMLSFWYPILLLAIPPALWMFHRRQFLLRKPSL